MSNEAFDREAEDVASECPRSVIVDGPESRTRDMVGLNAQAALSQDLVPTEPIINTGSKSPMRWSVKSIPASDKSRRVLPWTTPSTSALSLVQQHAAGTNTIGVADLPQLSHAPSQSLKPTSPESLFQEIRIYFVETCRDMKFDNKEKIVSPNGGTLRNNLCTDFDSYCFTATMLQKKGLNVEFQHILSKACTLVKDIHRAEHPQTLACFFEVLIHLMQCDLPDVAIALRAFITKIAAETSRKGARWHRICLLLGELDRESLAMAMERSWKCMTDAFDSALGTRNRLAVAVRLDYIKRVFADPPKEEACLRGVLKRLGDTPTISTPRVMLNLAHSLNRQQQHREARKIAEKVWCGLASHEMYVEMDAERIECLKVIGRSQYIEGNTLEAEQTMRDAIQMIVDLWGSHHPWAVEFMNVLEGWFRDWGCERDANTLRGQIEILMKQVVVD